MQFSKNRDQSGPCVLSWETFGATGRAHTTGTPAQSDPMHGHIRIAACGIALAAMLAGAVCGDEGLSIPVGESRLPTAVQRGNRLYLYWPGELVMEPILTAHDLPDLKPYWSHSPETSVTRYVFVGSDRRGGQETRPGIASLSLAADVLIYSGQGQQASPYDSVGIDGQTGAVRYRLPWTPYFPVSSTGGLAETWMLNNKGLVFETATGTEIAQLAGYKWNRLYSSDDALIYFANSTEYYRPATHLRRMRLPSGVVDTDIKLTDVFIESDPYTYDVDISAIREDLVVLTAMPRDYGSFLAEPRRFVGVDLTTARRTWTAEIPHQAPVVFVTQDPELPVLVPGDKTQTFARQHPPTVPVPAALAGSIAIDLATGERMFGSHFREPRDMLAWYGESLRKPDGLVQIAHSDTHLWGLIPAGSPSSASTLTCLDLATGNLLWESRMTGLSSPRLAEGASVMASDYLVVVEADIVHVIRRDTGEVVGKITPQDVGATLRPVRASDSGSTEPMPTFAARFVLGPWLERWLLALPALPLVIWLVWQFARRRPVA